MADLLDTLRRLLRFTPLAGSKADLGRSGEKTAKKHLRKCGYRHLQSNFDAKGGEIDLIMQDGKTIVFVEVKTRRNETFANAEAVVNPRKQSHIETAAKQFIKSHDLYDWPCRFDVVIVAPNHKGKLTVRHHKNAFHAKR